MGSLAQTIILDMHRSVQQVYEAPVAVRFPAPPATLTPTKGWTTCRRISKPWGGNSVTIPITNGQLNLGTWQGLYLCEHRTHGGPRRLVATAWGEPAA